MEIIIGLMMMCVGILLMIIGDLTEAFEFKNKLPCDRHTWETLPNTEYRCKECGYRPKINVATKEDFEMKE